MKKKIIFILSFLFIIFGLIGCTSSKKDLTGKYYHYDNDELNMDDWYNIISETKWEDSSGLSGRLEIDGNDCTFYSIIFGEENKLMSGIISDGKLQYEMLGSTYTYYKEGKQPVNSENSTKPSNPGGDVGNSTKPSNPGGDVVEKYIVTFKNYDGTILKTIEVEKSKNAVYTGSTPFKPSNDNISYEFIGWDKSLENILEDTTFTAVFEKALPSSSGFEFELSSDKSYYILTGKGNVDENEIVIPKTHNGKPVSEIASGALAYLANTTKITIQSNIKIIGEGALSGCSNLKELVLPFAGSDSSLTKASELTMIAYIFGNQNYSDSYSVNVSLSSFNKYGNVTYYIPTSLKSVTITGGNLYKYALEGLKSLESIYIKMQVNEIEELAIPSSSVPDAVLYYEESGENNFSDTLKSIPEYYGVNEIINTKNADYLLINDELVLTNVHNNVTSFTFEDVYYNGKSYKVSEIGYAAFYRCLSLNTIDIPNSVKKIGSFAFGYANKLESISLSNNITTISPYTFTNCALLSDIDLPSNLKIIEDYAFYNCKNLKDINLSSSVVKIDSNAFSNCKGLTQIDLPVNLSYLVDQVFYGCTSLVNVKIYENLDFIGIDVFYNCNSLEYNIKKVNYSDHKYLGNDSNKYVLLISAGGSISSYIMMDDTYYIYSKAFSNYISMSEITLSNNLKYIGDEAFLSCTNLKEITLPKSLKALGANVFKNCSHLKSAFISSGITIIPEGAFSNCTSLEEVIFDGNIVEISANAFYNCSSLKEIETSNSLTTIGSEAFSGCTKLGDIGLYKSVGTVGKSAFLNCDLVIYVEGISIPSSWDENFNPSNCTIEFVDRIPAKYIATFVNYDGTILYTVKIRETETLTYNGTTPTKPKTQEYSYEFSNFEGFTDNYKLTKDTTFTAQFNTIKNKYTVEFIDYSNNKVLYSKTIDYGTIITYPTSILEKEGNQQYSYEFNYIKNYNDNTPITKNVTYYVYFDAIVNQYTVTLLDNDGTILNTYTANYGTAYELETPEEKEGYAFAGWLDENNIYVSSLTIKSDCSLKAVYVVGSNALSYKLNSTKTGYIVNGIGNCSDDSIVIPNEFMGLPIQEISSTAFNNTNIKSITIPSSINTISSNPFIGCELLESIIIDSDNQVYDSRNNCNAIISKTTNELIVGCKNTVIDNTVTGIASSAFSGCSGLISFKIPNTVTNIGMGIFAGCSSLESLTLPFVGDSIKSSIDTYQYPLGYIFGTSSYTGGVATKQYYYGSSTFNTSYSTYYIPSTLKEVTILGGDINYGAFYNCSNLTSIEIPNSVTSIGASAFYSCSNLTSIEIPNSVTSIGASAFNNCSKLNSLELSSSIIKIPSALLYGCSSLESLALPFIGDSIKSSIDTYQYPLGYIFGTSSYTGGVATKQYYYGSSTFNTSYSTYYIPSTLKEVTILGGDINYGAFYNCSNLTSIEIPNSVTSIGASAFYSCSNLTSIEIPNSVTSIGASAFYSCSNLTSIEIPNSVTSIGASTFSSCSNLTSITIPFVGETLDGTENVHFGYIFGANSYSVNSTYVSNLKEVIITGGINIGTYAFYGCSNLTSITIPNSVTSIGQESFYNCSSLTSIAIPNSVTSIGASAFYSCSSLTSIAIPSSVISIGLDSFSSCSSISSIIVDSNNQVFDSRNNCNAIINKSTNELIVGCKNTIIGNTVTSIASNAFSGCSGLTSIEIPNSVTSIGASTFSSCSNLTSITIPFVGETLDGTENVHFGYIFGANSYSVNSTYVSTNLKEVIITGGTNIGTYAFYGCNNLTSITIPNSVTSIGASAFYSCSSLTSITIPSSVISIGLDSFSSCSSISSIIVDSNNQVYDSRNNCNAIINKSTNELIVGCKNTIFDNTVTSIASNAFSGCSGLTSLEIPNSVTYIGKKAFYGCSNLTSITIPFVGSGSGYSFLGYIFGGSYYTNNSTFVPKNLKEVIITGGTNIATYAFYDCNLTSITIPNSVTRIESLAFAGCNYLTSITMSNSVTYIGQESFDGCSSLTSITIPNSVTRIDGSAFFSCSGLTNVYYEGTLEEWCNIDFSNSYSNPMYYADHFFMLNENNEWFEIIQLIIPETIKEIEYCQFYGFESLTSIIIPSSVTSISIRSFDECDNLKTVYYTGTAIDWNDLSNGNLTSATIYYYSDTQPTTTGNYWHYDTDGVTPIVW